MAIQTMPNFIDQQTDLGNKIKKEEAEQMESDLKATKNQQQQQIERLRKQHENQFRLTLCKKGKG